MPPSSPLLWAPSRAVIPGVRRLAVLRANGLGDLVVALPALHAVRAAYPAAEITYLGSAWHPELLRTRPGPWDRVVVVPPCPGVRDGEPAEAAEITATVRALTAEGPLDLVGRLSLPAMVGLLHRCRLVVGNDSGPRHLAAAVGTATVGVF